ncbi:hypothetical protein KDL01_01775 [Actinospica durhamensis]|uniref:Uncharacterized protein n=1 Tax=Actinospica durhamensis TaxID=1508375 RepID=A0A941EMX0_9ACTN|nr:hypothetical protein [Actinospica durhamensis]MBR7831969.1 hypothetical protein [Actinospica durhamensis]
MQDPIVIEVRLAGSPRIPGTDEHALPGFGDARVAAGESFARARPRNRVEIRMVDFRALPEEVGAANEQGQRLLDRPNAAAPACPPVNPDVLRGG